MELTGRIKSISDIQHISDKFKKQEFVLETEINTPYAQTILMECQQDTCDKLNQFNDGDEVKVFFNIRGRQHNGANGLKTYNSIVVWKIMSNVQQ